MPTIPLALEMRPVVNRLGPVVYLGQGDWEISSVGLVDSEIELISQLAPKPEDVRDMNELPGKREVIGKGIKVKGGLKQILFKKAGSEQKVSIFATQIENGNQPSNN